MKQIDGNLLDMAENGDFDVIVHGCNCFCRMGAGIAKQIKDRYPTACAVDYMTQSGNPRKLGTYTSTLQSEANGYMFVLINAYTQFTHDAKTMPVDYNAIKEVMRTINRTYKGCRVGIPMIGAGLAGGDWNIISRIIDNEMIDVDLTLVVYVPDTNSNDTNPTNFSYKNYNSDENNPFISK